MYKVKQFMLKKSYVDKNGKTHFVCVYGELTKTNQHDGITIFNSSFTEDGTIRSIYDKPINLTPFNKSRIIKKFNFGWAICHPTDTFNDETAIKLCKRRFAKTPIITQEGKFLTHDMIMAILDNEIEFLIQTKLKPLDDIDEKTNVPSQDKNPKFSPNDIDVIEDGDVVQVKTMFDGTYYGVYKGEENEWLNLYWGIQLGKNVSSFSVPCNFYYHDVCSVIRVNNKDEVAMIMNTLKNTYYKLWDKKEKKLVSLVKKYFS